MDFDDFCEVYVCPYNKSHKINKARVQYHLVKCEKNYPENYLETCPYNATHRCFKKEMLNHIITCPDNCKLEPNADSSSTISIVNEIDMGLICGDESWESELESEYEKRYVKSLPKIKENELIDSMAKKAAPIAEPENLRKPKTQAIARMVEASDLSELDEQDKLSVTSSMGFGRGNRAKLQLNVMRAVGRSSRLQFDSDLESSASRRGSIPKETLDDDDFHPLFYNDPTDSTDTEKESDDQQDKEKVMVKSLRTKSGYMKIYNRRKVMSIKEDSSDVESVTSSIAHGRGSRFINLAPTPKVPGRKLD